jgi:SAM-dependent methyltransferase
VGGTDPYYLGYRTAETQRLQRQAAEFADDSAWLFDQLGPLGGARVLEIGCGPHGCLDALSERVGPSGSVIGVERSEEAVALARGLVAESGLANVEVVCGDARRTSLPRQSFDLVTWRLVLINVPAPEQIVAEAVALARPGGHIACHEAMWPPQTIDPPLPAWDRLYAILQAYARSNGIDAFIGRRLPRLLREHGVADVQARPVIKACPIGHGRRMLAAQFVDNLAERVVAQGLVTGPELAELSRQLKQHLEDPDTFVIGPLYIQVWGRGGPGDITHPEPDYASRQVAGRATCSSEKRGSPSLPNAIVPSGHPRAISHGAAGSMTVTCGASDAQFSAARGPRSVGFPS